MDDNESRAQHITEIDLDLSPIWRQFEVLNNRMKLEGSLLREIVSQQWDFNVIFKKHMKETINEFSHLSTAAKKTKLNFDVNSATTKLELLEKQLKELSNEIEKLNQIRIKPTVDMSGIANEQLPNNKAAEGYLAKATKWFSTYQALNLAKNTAIDTISTIKNVEYSMTEIARVINDTNFDINNFQNSIFELSKEFGVTYDQAAGAALRFAQAGHNANEVLKLTRASLLAVNTAELDVGSASESLSGIIAQWGLQADQLENIIDKINANADDFTLTSQDLIDALLRSSSSAKLMGLNLDELIAYITAAETASQRGGKTIGTALNSVFTYLGTKDKRLKMENLGIQVYADKAKTALLPLNQIIAQLAKRYDELTAKGEGQVLVDALGIKELVGTYRGNIFAGMLQQMGTYQKSLEVSAHAAGYSINENNRTMQTLEKQTQSLIASLQELSVQAGKNGLMDLSKGAVSAASSLVSLTKGIGGLVPVTQSLFGLWLLIKREKIATDIDGIAKAIATLPNALKGVNTAATGTAASLGTVGTAANGALGAIGLLTTTFGLASMAISANEQKFQQHQQTIDDTTQAYQDQISNLDSLSTQYTSLIATEIKDEDTRKQLANIQQQVVDLLGNEAEALDLVNGKYDENIQKIDSARLARLKEAKASAQAALNLANESSDNPSTTEQYLFDLLPSDHSTWIAPENLDAWKALAKWDDEAQHLKVNIAALTNAVDLQTYGTAAERTEALGKALEYLSNAGYRTSDVYTALSLAQQHYSEIAQTVTDKTQVLNDITAEIQVTTKFQNSELPKTVSEYQEIRKTLVDAAIASGEYAGTQQEIGHSIDSALQNLPNLSDEIKQYATATSEATSNTEIITSAISNLEAAQSALGAQLMEIENLQKQISDGHEFSYSEIQKLLASYPSLEAAIHKTANGWQIEKQAVDALYSSTANLDVEYQSVQQAMSEALNSGVAIRLEQLGIELDAVKSTMDAYAKLRKAAESMLSGMQNWNNSVGSWDKEQFKSFFGSDVVELTLAAGRLNELKSKLKDLQSGGIIGNSGTNSSADKALTAAKKQAQSYIKDLQKASKAEQDSIQKVIDAKKKAQKADDDYYNRRIKKIKAQYDEDIKGLRRVKEERSRNRERTDIQEELDYWNQRTGTEAVEKIKDLKEQLSHKEEDWELDDKITSLEDERDEEVAYLEKKRDRVKANYDEEIELLEQKKAKVKEDYDEQIGYIQDVYNNCDASANQILQAVENVKNGQLTAIQTAADAVNNAITSVAQTAQSAFGGVGTPGGGSVDSRVKGNPGTGSHSNGLDSLFANQFNMVENLKQAQLQAIEEVIEESINKYDDANKTMLNSAAFKAPEIANQYKEKLVMAVHDNAILQFNSANNTLVVSAGGYAAKLLDQYDSKFLTPLRDRLESILEDIRDARSERESERKRSSKSSKSSNRLKRSHTGSLITKSGIVDVQMGEIIVRRDISEGLLQVIADNNSRMQAARNYYSTSNANSVDNSRKSETVVKVQGPLVQIEKQEFTPEYKPEMAGNTLARTLKRRIGVKR